jgi:hypothetical protein
MTLRKVINRMFLPLGYVLETYDTGAVVLGNDLLDDGLNHEAALLDSGWVLRYDVYRLRSQDGDYSPRETLMEGEFVVAMEHPLGDEIQFHALALQLFGLSDTPPWGTELTPPPELVIVRDAIMQDPVTMSVLFNGIDYPLEFQSRDGTPVARTVP